MVKVSNHVLKTKCFLFSDHYACVIFRRELADSDRKSLALVDDKLVVKLEVLSNNLGTIQQGVTTINFVPSFYWYITSTTLVVGSHVTLCILATEAVRASLKVSTCKLPQGGSNCTQL